MKALVWVIILRLKALELYRTDQFISATCWTLMYLALGSKYYLIQLRVKNWMHQSPWIAAMSIVLMYCWYVGYNLQMKDTLRYCRYFERCDLIVKLVQQGVMIFKRQGSDGLLYDLHYVLA
ncbi:hypothetical protein Hanom_Chr07g00618131 [Helianthus anomalus]